MRVYFDVCDPFGTGDIEEVVNRFLDGRVKDHNASFAPTPPMMARELRVVQEDRLKFARMEREAQRQIEARIRDEDFGASKTPESRARVKALIDATVLNIASKDEANTALDERVKALQDTANNRPEFVEERASSAYKARLRYSAGDQQGRDD